MPEHTKTRWWVSGQRDFTDQPRGIDAERLRQIKLFSAQHYSPERWLAILVEEVGELSQEINELMAKGNTSMPIRKGERTGQLQPRVDFLEEELVQVAAVACAWLEDLRGHYVETPPYPCSDTHPEVPLGYDPARWWE